MFAVKVPGAYLWYFSFFCGLDGCRGEASAHANGRPAIQRNSIIPHLLSAVTERRKSPYHAVVRPGKEGEL